MRRERRGSKGEWGEGVWTAEFLKRGLSGFPPAALTRPGVCTCVSWSLLACSGVMLGYHPVEGICIDHSPRELSVSLGSHCLWPQTGLGPQPAPMEWLPFPLSPPGCAPIRRQVSPEPQAAWRRRALSVSFDFS